MTTEPSIGLTSLPPSPETNTVLRHLQGVRHEMAEMQERQARVIDLVNRLTLKVEQGFRDVRRDLTNVRSV